MTTTARATAVGALWNYGAQTATVVLQLGYAAISSRLLGPEAFGEYGVALVVGALVTLLATAGLPQAVSRMPRMDGDRLAGLLSYAVVVGFAAALLLLGTAGGWAALWGIPGAGDPVRVLAVAAVFTPALALATGVLLRLGRFRALAITTLAGNAAGMGVGLAAIYLFRTPAMLVVSQVVAQASAALACLWQTRRAYRGRPARSVLTADMTYSLGLIASALLGYAAGNIGKFAVGRVLGGGLLGHWNRGEVITAVPFYQVQNALIQALFPQFRHDLSSTERARRVWADLLGLVAWLCLPAAAVLAVVSPALVEPVFGPGWSLVRDLVPVLAVVAGLQALSFVLVSALEVLGKFRWMWAGYALAIVVNAAGGMLAWRHGSATPILVAAVAAWVGMHGLHVWLCARAGLLRLGALLAHYTRVLLVSALLAALALAVVRAPRLAGEHIWFLPALVIAIGGCGAFAWRYRHRLPPVHLAAKYGLFHR